MDLLARIQDDRPASGVTLWWLGQSGFVVRGGGATIVLDAYLTDGGGRRRYAPPIAPEDVVHADLLLGTHDHRDHIDPEGLPAMAVASPQAVIVVPAPAVRRVIELGIPPERVLGAEVGVPLESNGVRVVPIPALHAPSMNHGYGFHRDELGRYPFLGYALELDGVRLCHVGDTLAYDGLGKRLRELALDALVLPINGRSWYRERRGIAGNMNVVEAAELAAESGARCVVPVHWDLFARNSGDPEHFRSYVATLHLPVEVVIPVVGTGIPVAAAAV